LIIDDQSTEVEMGDGDWTAPDGKVNYRNYRVSFLLRLGSEADGERYSYTKDDTVTRAVAKQQRLAVNRLTLEIPGRESWLSYEAQSGFIVADSGGSYSVENAAYDPLVEAEEGQPRVSPRLVKVERQPNTGGKPQMWSRDWAKGLEIFSEPDGKLTRRTWIMAKGPAYGKLRRVEEQVDGNWEMVKTMTYRPDGRLLREIDEKGNVTQYVQDLSRGSMRNFVLSNGQMVELKTFDSEGRLTKHLDRSGRTEIYYWDQTNGFIKEIFQDEELIGRYKGNSDGVVVSIAGSLIDIN
jgi:YD repeat-containing protein